MPSRWPTKVWWTGWRDCRAVEPPPRRRPAGSSAGADKGDRLRFRRSGAGQRGAGLFGLAGIWSERGQELVLEEWAKCIGTGQGEHTFEPFAELARRASPQIDREIEPEVRARHQARMAELMTGRPPLAGVAAWLRGGHTGGSGNRGGIQFDPVVDRGAPGPSRPQPVLRGDLCVRRLRGQEARSGLYRLACRQLGVSPGEALAVEDSRNGLLAAKAAGLFCVVVPNVMTAHMDFSEADVILASLEEAGPLEVMERIG